MHYPYSLQAPHTLTILADLGQWADGTAKQGFVSECDCLIGVDYENIENWEIGSVTFEHTQFNEEFSVTAKSDPALWALITRAIDFDWKELRQIINEMIVQARVDLDDERGDFLHDLRNEAA